MVKTPHTVGAAVISPCGLYRYELFRGWGDKVGWRGHILMWLMLNPSTADANANDHTIRRLILLSIAWGYSSLIVGNLYALRATNPRRLWDSPDPVGEKNYTHLRTMAAMSEHIVLAWGKPGPYSVQPARTRAALIDHREKFRVLGYTKDGEPRHPLMIRNDVVLQPWGLNA